MHVIFLHGPQNFVTHAEVRCGGTTGRDLVDLVESVLERCLLPFHMFAVQSFQ